MGVLTNGVPIGKRMAGIIAEKASVEVPVGSLDVALYRDDIFEKGHYITVRESDIPFDLTGKTVVLVDDVLFHGRTIRAALDGLMDFGRPRRVDLAVLVDRGHRDLPIMANFVGETLETEVEEIQAEISTPEFFQQDPALVSERTQLLEDKQKELEVCYEDWERLEALKEELENG